MRYPLKLKKIKPTENLYTPVDWKKGVVSHCNGARQPSHCEVKC